ncbi:MAG: hypothetical protein SO100_09890 [Dysosmobacter sp.]|nr:hypothetical protein [Dysosmobacter sp.]
MKVGTKIAILKITVFLGIILFLFHKLAWGLAFFAVNLILRLVVFCRCPHCGKVVENAFQPGTTCPNCGETIE